MGISLKREQQQEERGSCAGVSMWYRYRCLICTEAGGSRLRVKSPYENTVRAKFDWIEINYLVNPSTKLAYPWILQRTLGGGRGRKGIDTKFEFHWEGIWVFELRPDGIEFRGHWAKGWNRNRRASPIGSQFTHSASSSVSLNLAISVHHPTINIKPSKNSWDSVIQGSLILWEEEGKMSFGLGLEFGLGLGLPGGRCRNRLFRLCSSRALAPCLFLTWSQRWKPNPFFSNWKTNKI